MELLQLKYFCDAAETENFSKTAKKYLVPTSNISQSIKRLERELGVELFEHKANKITLNSEGKLFYDKVSEALNLLESGAAQFSERGGCLYGDIRLACLGNRRTVTSAIEKFVQKNPCVNFIIRHDLDSNLDFDIIISDTCPYEYSERILLLDEEICVAMNVGNPLAKKESISPSELENEKFITMASGSSLQRITNSVCTGAGFSPKIAIQTDDPFYVRKYIEMGLGIAFVPTFSWKGVFSENVAIKPIGNIRRQTYAFFPKRKCIKQPLATFVQALKDEMEH